MSSQWKITATAIAATAALVLAGCGTTSATNGAAGHMVGVNAAAASTGQLRTYYIAADEVLWDYAPDGTNAITGEPFTADEEVFTAQGPNRVGHKYWKSLYRGYTDATFTKLIARPASCARAAKACDDSLGMLGPVIRAVVGDTIKVVFKNNTSFPASVHAHGVLYEKDSEGAPYADNTSGADKRDDAVRPGARHTYSWKVPERAGPADMDASSVVWMYHSHTDEVADTNAGLIGPMVITGRGQADQATATPLDVDDEIFSYFTVENENASPYLDKNLQEVAGAPHSVPVADEEAFEESNLMHSINGYVYGNGPVPTVSKGQRVRWYVISLGTEVDLHTPHWHGNTVTMMGMRTDMAELLPGSMKVADMQPDAIGTWLYHCHVNDHIVAGMQMRYRVIA
ncbi:MAG: multicopper oxidase domain-containing protein [Dermatophilaceae bacterium]